VPRVASVLDLFQLGAYWTAKQVAEARGRLRDSDVRHELQRLCHYVRAGPHAACWVLRAELRTPQTPLPDADDYARASTGEKLGEAT